MATLMLRFELSTGRVEVVDAPEARRAIIAELLDYHEGTQLIDDAVVVCLDWKPPT